MKDDYVFEYDSDKSAANAAKHNIDFAQAQMLWDDESLVAIPARSDDEPRDFMIGVIESKHFTAVVTYRELRIRIISVRRAREKESEYYESQRIR